MNTLFVVLFLLPFAFVLGWLSRWFYARYRLSAAEESVSSFREKALVELEHEKERILLGAREKVLQEKLQQERELKNSRHELQRFEKRLLQKEDHLDKKLSALESQQGRVTALQRENESTKERLAKEGEKLKTELERIAGVTSEEAKRSIIEKIQGEAQQEARLSVAKIEGEAQLSADKKVREILITALQRIASEVSTEVTVDSVPIPSEDMKGRIIGREGRNIRALETLTGVDIIVDDTPEAVVISCFDPVRKIVARKALERLIADGRIHPTRIEEVVQKVVSEIEKTIFEEGEKAAFDLGIHNLSPRLTSALGRLHFRTSYGQNVLMHSKEVASVASLLAAEIGENPLLAKRAALLHDLGKGLFNDDERGHAEAGADFARKEGEDELIVNAIASHHNDVEPKSLIAILVQIADSASASRPGARRETLDNYIKRLQQLEEIAESFKGVEKCYAIQAGREVRIIVNNGLVDDLAAKDLARDIAKRIEEEMRYPGRVKVTLIRETRVIEYAR